MWIKFFKQHTLRDGEDLGGEAKVDRGDEVTQQAEKPPTDEEKKLAADLKDKEAADAKAAAEKKEADAKKEAESEEDDPDNPGKKRDSRIPLKRHKEILESERAARAKAEAALAQYQRSDEVSRTNEELAKAEDTLIAMEAEYNKLVNDGKPDEAAKKMTAIRRQEREVNDVRTDLKTRAAESRAYERARYDTAVERIEAAYPVLNEDNKEHDDPDLRYKPELARKVLSVAKAYQIDGMTPAAALQEAVKDLLGDPKTKKQDEAVNVKPNVSEAAAAKAKRDEEARRKAADAAGKQPADSAKTGKASDALGGSLTSADVMKMSFDDFNKLDEATLARMRGDVVGA